MFELAAFAGAAVRVKGLRFAAQRIGVNDATHTITRSAASTSILVPKRTELFDLAINPTGTYIANNLDLYMNSV